MVARQMPGTAAALGWSRDNDAQFQFMMQMGYQAGSSWYRTDGAYSKLADAIRVGDQEKAVQALAATPAYKLSQDERKQYYVQTLLAGMQE
ncbi:internal head protein [Escherichia phage altidsur]|uniref:Internal head protein n=2 Tax=root TaxID=1 RepID=A0A6B9WNA6_9CAUD|nr:internal head protein [Escherichia phage altidsur]